MWPVANSFWEIFPGALAVTVLLTATAWAIFHGKACGFLGAWFFLILAPTSSVLAINGLMYEHRTYLSLAAAAVLVVTGGYAICERLLPRLLHNGRPATLARRAAAGALLTAVLIAMGWATAARNEDYRSMLAMWQGVVEEWPCHPLAHRGLGVSLADLGKTAEAVEQFHEVLRLDPRDGNAHQDLGLALADLGKTDEAIEQLHEALRVDPECAMARYNLGLILARSGKTGEAVAQFREAVRLKPDYAEAHAHLANALLMAGNTDEAIKHLRETLRLTAENAEAHNNLANLLVGRGENDAAIEHYTAALRLKPDYARAHNNLATLLAALGRSGQAIEHYREAVRLKPDYAAALNGLAWLLATRRPEDGGDPAVAVEMAERLQGLGGRENPRCLDTLAAAYAAAGRFPEAVATAEKALQLAESAGELPLARDIQLRLDLYRAGHAYRQPP
jgi:Flp pilus assembly protein TadD